MTLLFNKLDYRSIGVNLSKHDKILTIELFAWEVGVCYKSEAEELRDEKIFEAFLKGIQCKETSFDSYQESISEK